MVFRKPGKFVGAGLVVSTNILGMETGKRTKILLVNADMFHVLGVSPLWLLRVVWHDFVSHNASVFRVSLALAQESQRECQMGMRQQGEPRSSDPSDLRSPGMRQASALWRCRVMLCKGWLA